MELERKNVRFTSELSTADNYVCNACHGTGQVLMLSLPETLMAEYIKKFAVVDRLTALENELQHYKPFRPLERIMYDMIC